MTLASDRGAVYFVQGAGLVKVGWTIHAPLLRVRNLQTMSPVPLVLLAALPAVRSLERSLHERMAEWRRDRYESANEVVEFATSLANLFHMPSAPERIRVAA